ncbi:hypothetical protein UFOVP648_17 [uncultured Caudovirales phage]|uniref:Uncharacterized protein n=1 Tax=uncultured Caudovirales phage TaxID=2100421 RepID=A0A6J5N979_9CAUD|nr:hypothetical protein UFOVP648_17 [uncultured Caudovirales phage]
MKNSFLKSLVEFVFQAKVALSEVTLEDGTMVEIDEETMVASKMLEDGSMEVLAEGTYKLMDGSELVVGPNGVVEPQVSAPVEVPAEEIVAEEVVTEQFTLENKIALESQVSELTSKFEELNAKYEELLKTSVEKFKSVERVISEKPLTKLEAVKKQLTEKYKK